MSVERPSMQKQLSLNAGSDPRVFVSPVQLDRRNTVTLPRSAGKSMAKAFTPGSPLKRFTQAKESISRVFGRIHDHLQEVKQFLAGIATTADKSDEVQLLVERTSKIKAMLGRDQMKVAFFGRTSNGKSTVINALLHDKVLPSGIGHTTSCFCSVVGYQGDDGFLLVPGSSQRQNVKSVQQLAHAVHKEESLEPSGLIQVHWPMTRCALLKDDVMLMDSPGIDMNPNVDEWIDRHCMDADVFVLVSNAESTLMNTEKSFFHRVSEKLSKPNIFILNNRWDASAQEPEMMDEVRKQHLERNVAFLSKELGVVDEVVARDRVFFVSAKEVVYMRTKQIDSSSPQHGIYLAEGYQARLLEFQQFEEKLKACLSSAAIRTKFEQHHIQATGIVEQLEVLLTDAEQQCSTNCQQLAQQLQEAKERQQHLRNNCDRVQKSCVVFASTVAKSVCKKVVIAMGDTKGQLLRIVEEFEEMNFDPQNLSPYTEALYQCIDAEVIEKLRQRCSDSLQLLHNQGLGKVADEFQEVLCLPEEKISPFVHLIRRPEPPELKGCDQLCQHFNPNLTFTSTIGLQSLIRAVQHFNIDLPSILLGTNVNQSYLLPVATAGITALVLIRYISWPVIATGAVCYGLFYCYERLRWTVGAQRSTFNHQLTEHLHTNITDQIAVTDYSYSRIIDSDLTNQIERLSREVESAQVAEGEKVRNLAQEHKKFLQLQEHVKWLRNASRLLHTDLADFHDVYLEEQLD